MSTTANNNSSNSNGELKPSDFEVPAACVNRIIKSVLADNVMITKDARAAIVRAVSIFIFYITHGANDFSREAKRQTIFPIDIINSLKDLGFEEFEKPLEDFLDAFKKEAAKAPASGRKKSSKNADESMNVDDEEDQGEENEEEEEVNVSAEMEED